MTPSTTTLPAPRRRIVPRTRGHSSGGPITRLMSPSDLGQSLKPFVFLDIFDASGPTLQAMGEMPLHPHSGIATVTVFTEGRMRYHDPAIGSGTIGYGGVEWMRAGSGVWHGKEMTPDDVPRIQGFQLWLALPPDLENSAPVSRYVEATQMSQAGSAHVIVGEYDWRTTHRRAGPEVEERGESADRCRHDACFPLASAIGRPGTSTSFRATLQ